MKAFIIDGYGKKMGAGRIAKMPLPTMSDHDVMVEVHAASVNPLDYKIHSGLLKLFLPYKFPLVMGNDLAGIVVKVGSKVTRFKSGDEVYSRPEPNRIGAFAEYIAVHENALALMPKSLSMQEAASIPLVGLTSWQALVEKAQLENGQKVFIHAGSGGVGSFAIQLAKSLGATVSTTTSTKNIDLVKALGADIAIDYTKANFEDLLEPQDVILSGLDGTTLRKSAPLLNYGGTLVSLSGPPDLPFAKDLGLNWFLQQLMRLLSLRTHLKVKKQNANYAFLFMKESGDQLSKIASLIDTGEIKPVIDRVYPFHSIQEALDYVETGRVKGKVVVSIR